MLFGCGTQREQATVEQAPEVREPFVGDSPAEWFDYYLGRAFENEFGTAPDPNLEGCLADTPYGYTADGRNVVTEGFELDDGIDAIVEVRPGEGSTPDMPYLTFTNFESGGEPVALDEQTRQVLADNGCSEPQAS